MRKKKTGEEPRRLTDVELEIMNILWRLGEAGVADVIAQLPAGRDLAYTSVSTMLRILEGKQVVSARKEGRGHVYVPRLGRADYEARAVRDVVDRVFAGAPAAMVRQLLESVEMSAEDLREVRRLLGQVKERK
jgi:predicted transcriptional regulator